MEQFLVEFWVDFVKAFLDGSGVGFGMQNRRKIGPEGVSGRSGVVFGGVGGRPKGNRKPKTIQRPPKEAPRREKIGK